MKNIYNVIGLMSGTSLDGLDIAFCRFHRVKKDWEYEIVVAETVRYSARWTNALKNAHTHSAESLLALDAAYGKYIGTCCADFIKRHNVKPDLISSHGHTVFHQPENGFTFQLGNGNAIHAVTDIPVIADLRSLDVALGGEGAPLVPIGDELLFSSYDVCLNLGGIANISLQENRSRIAFDVCFCNMPLNELMQQRRKRFDRNGELAASGKVNAKLYAGLSRVYAGIRAKRPSLGRELYEDRLKPLLDKSSAPIEDKLATCVESCAAEIVAAVTASSPKKTITMLCTGGGAFNSFLMSRILDLAGDRIELIIPDENVVKFKEALVFAFLGVLKSQGKVNSLKSVTGASRDSSSGVMIGF